MATENQQNTIEAQIEWWVWFYFLHIDNWTVCTPHPIHVLKTTTKKKFGYTNNTALLLREQKQKLDLLCLSVYALWVQTYTWEFDARLKFCVWLFGCWWLCMRFSLKNSLNTNRKQTHTHTNTNVMLRVHTDNRFECIHMRRHMWTNKHWHWICERNSALFFYLKHITHLN